jgi:hypothetical protein
VDVVVEIFSSGSSSSSRSSGGGVSGGSIRIFLIKDEILYKRRDIVQKRLICL